MYTFDALRVMLSWFLTGSELKMCNDAHRKDLRLTLAVH